LSEVFEERFRYYRFSKNEKEVLLKKIKEFLSRYDIDLAIVFGSFVEGDVFRDIDIAIYSYAMDLDKLLKINSELELELGIPVDIVPLDQLNPIFRLKILRKGLVIVEKPGVFEYFFMLTCDELEVMRIALNGSLPRCT
jgi:predicted nucleotidyltransferase